jgi:MFS family permease
MTPQKKIHLINFSRKLAVNPIFFLIPLHFLKIGFDGWQIGAIVSLFALAPLLFSFPIGLMNDRISINRLIQSALFLQSIIFLLIGLTDNFFLMAAIFLLLGISNNALDVSTNSLYFKDETDIDLNKKYGLLAFWLAFGAAVGNLFGGFLTYFAGFSTLFYVYSIFILIILLSVGKIGQEKFHSVSLKEYRLNLFNRKTILFCVLIFTLTLHWGAEGTVYSPFLRSFFHLNNLQISLYISLPLFVLAFSAFFIGLLKYDARVNKRIFLLSMFLSGLGLILMVNRNVFFSFLFRVVHEVGDGFIGALNVLFISRLFEKKSIGGSAGMLLAVMTLGQMVGALFFSPLGHRAGLQYPFIISGLILIANTVFSFYVFKKNHY